MNRKYLNGRVKIIMWGRMKNTLKQWFDNEEMSEEKTKPENVQTNQHREEKMETKVSYQYPRNRSFNFPLDVDQPTNKESRKVEPELKQSKTQLKREEVPKANREDIKKRPFRASDVPSPVYGFQTKMKETKVDNIDNEVPAFIRKKEERNNINMLITEQTNEEEKKDAVINAVEDSSVDLDQSEKNDQDQIQVGNSTPLKPISEVEYSVENKEISNEKSKKTVDMKKKDPFNVRMRPSDKRRYYSAENKKENYKDTVSPPLHLLDDHSKALTKDNRWLEEQADRLIKTLEQFQVRAHVINTMQGPTVTRFEIQPEAGVKVSKIKNLTDDLKLNLAAEDIRIEAPIPGKHAIGIEIPNPISEPVRLQTIFSSSNFKENESPVTVGLGLDITGSSVVTDLKRMPHGLIAGATGSGKSVCINTILISLLYKAQPKDVRLLLIDPKMVELAAYNEIPHLVSPVITDVKAATHALKWAVTEMEDRYLKFVETGTRDIERYNKKMLAEARNEEKLPYLVIVIDELADLMMASPQDVEDSICRIAQKARACGIHLLLATQRPSVDVITGLIKANIPTRIAFSVSSQIDSRTILDTNGAERLLGKGDMLFIENGARTPVRIQGAFVSDEEIERITNFIRKTAPADYLFEEEQLLMQLDENEPEDEMYQAVFEYVLDKNSASTSLLQRQFKIGYNRAARLMDKLEQNGIISAQNGSKPRTVLVTANQKSDTLGS